ncbi:hypothetical protein BDW74DRAFT_162215 [Aspergillus multicolor]|uniref:uncharacterized protein n=1 Tax=Aspergillus multicolor TaxID=41759 RepID=UPI003CCD6D53
MDVTMTSTSQGSSSNREKELEGNNEKLRDQLRKVQRSYDIETADYARFKQEQEERIKDLYTVSQNNEVTWSRHLQIEAIFRAQIRDDYLNVIASNSRDNLVLLEAPEVRTAGRRKQKPKEVHQEIDDEYYRDKLNNIYNSGQSFKFTPLKYRPFYDHSSGVRLEPAPVQPVMDTGPADQELMNPVGQVIEKCPPTYRSTTVTQRAGRQAFFKPIVPQPEGFGKMQWDFVCRDDTYVSDDHVRLSEKCHRFKLVDWINLADDMRAAYGRTYR